MDQFTPQTIGELLIVLGAIWIAVRGFKHYYDRVDAEWSAKNPPLFPPELNDAGSVPPVSARDKEIAAAHVAKILPASLRTPLPYIRKADHLSPHTYRTFEQQREYEQMLANELHLARIGDLLTGQVTSSAALQSRPWTDSQISASISGHAISADYRNAVYGDRLCVLERYATAAESEGGTND